MNVIRLMFCLCLLFSTSRLFAQSSPQEDRLLGKCQREELTQTPYQDWYQSNYQGYTPNKEVVEQLEKINLKDYKFRVFFGSWCGDSKREVPRFLKIMDQLKVPVERVELIAVDKGEQYKQSPGGEEKGESIFRVPVFILLKGGKEVGRIVEYPVSSIERDLLAILKGQSYAPNYYSYPFLTDWYKQGILSDSNTDNRGLVNQIRGKVSSSSELNAAGYVFLKSNQIKEAIKVFILNVYLFPEETNSYDSLAEAYLAADNKEAALWAYEKILSKDPENEAAKKKVDELKALAGGAAEAGGK